MQRAVASISETAAIGPPRSAASKLALAVYLVGLIQGTLYPWTDWRSLGVPLFDFLREPTRYWSGFDIALNVLAYLPLGALAVWAGWPATRRLPALLGFVIAISALSLLLEAGQAFLPSRYPSRSDWLCNSAGGLVGALFGRLAAPAILERGWPRALRSEVLTADAGSALVLIALWVFAQLHPQPLLLATGEVIEPLIQWLWTRNLPMSSVLGYQLSSDQFIGIEAAALALAAGSIAVIVLEALRPPAPRAGWAIGLVVLAALAAKTASAAALLTPEQAFGWASAGAQAGLVVAGIWIYALRSLARITRLVLGAISLLAGIVLINIAPENAYYEAMIERIDPGRWVNLQGLSAFAASVWPFMALAYLLRKMQRAHRHGPAR